MLPLLLLLPFLSIPSIAESISDVPDMETLALSLTSVNLGRVSSPEDKRRFIYSAQLEKARVTRKLLEGIYENAFDLYKAGRYEGVVELTSNILEIDPGYEDAVILQRAAIELKGSTKPLLARMRLLDERFQDGMDLYRQGRLVEAAEHWEEVTKLDPSNLKASYWLKKCRGELALAHFEHGRQAYRAGRIQDALDQWYAALVLNPHYPHLSQAIEKVQTEQREREANFKIKSALDLYGRGQTLQALHELDEVLGGGPDNPKVHKLVTELRAEMAAQHAAEGRGLYESGKYIEAIKEWKTAVSYGFSPQAADQLIARAKEQMRLGREERRAVQEAERRREELARKKAEEEEAVAHSTAPAQAPTEVAPSTAPVQTPPFTQPPVAPVPPATPPPTSEDMRRSSLEHYKSGVTAMMAGNYQKAREECALAKQLDPGNSEAAACLERIDRIYRGGQ